MIASSQSKFYALLALILLAGAALIGYVLVKRGGGASADATELVSIERLMDDGSAEGLGVVRGSAEAPVVIEEYADYQCPACGMAATLTVPQILENYVDTGKARFVFYDFPLHAGSPAELGAQAARCAGDQGAFWPMHKVLMGRQREWGTSRDPVTMFRQYADGLGLDGGAIEECIESRKYRDVVLASGQYARQLGLNQTPTFVVDGEVVPGLRGYDFFAGKIEERLAKRSSERAGEGE